MGFSLDAERGDSSPAVVHGLFIAATLLLQSMGSGLCRLQQSWHMGSALWLPGSGAQSPWRQHAGWAALLHVGSSQIRGWARLPPWQAEFLPLSHHQEALSSSYCWSALPFLYFLWSLRILRTQVLSIQLFLETSSRYSKVMLNSIYLKPK